MSLDRIAPVRILISFFTASLILPTRDDDTVT